MHPQRPSRHSRRRRRRRFPRARGDAPINRIPHGPCYLFSPRARGCTLRGCVPVDLVAVFPARAGMHPSTESGHEDHGRFPRARGDAPSASSHRATRSAFSPRARGCTRSRSSWLARSGVFPARAGMHPRVERSCGSRHGFPRARGDAPQPKAGSAATVRFSPRARGCTLLFGRHLWAVHVFPARAGMHPLYVSLRRIRCGFPRARGDAPFAPRCSSITAAFSPRARGCTQRRGC